MGEEIFQLRPGELTLAELGRLMAGDSKIALDPAAWPAVEASAEVVRRIVAEGRTAYGGNTGFASLAKTRIATGEVAELQRRLVRSHAAGPGPLLEDRVV